MAEERDYSFEEKPKKKSGNFIPIVIACLFIFGFVRFVVVSKFRGDTYMACISYTSYVDRVLDIDTDLDDDEILRDRLCPPLGTLMLRVWQWTPQQMTSDLEFYNEVMRVDEAEDKKDEEKKKESESTFDERSKEWRNQRIKL